MKAGRILATVVLLAGAAGVASAQTAAHNVNFEVKAINKIAVTGAVSLLIDNATAGSDPTSATATAAWAITTNATNQKVTASINSAMPSGVTLSVTLGQPSGATSAGKKALANGSEADLVTAISTTKGTGLLVTYDLDATPEAGIVAATSRTVTYTITAGP